MRTPKQQILPSQHEARRVQKEGSAIDERLAREKAQLRLRQAVEALLKTDDGRIFWSWLFNRCGYNKPSLAYFAEGDVAPLKTECREAQRVVYLDARRLAPRELLVRAEEFAEFGGSESSENKGGA